MTKLAAPLNQSHRDWVRRRVRAVEDKYSVYDCLVEFGHGEMIPDRDTATQLSCMWHGEDATPSARYYPAEGTGRDRFHCFRCKLHMGALDTYGKFKGLDFMGSLKELERRLRIQVPPKPSEDVPQYVEPAERGPGYVSDAWGDVQRSLLLLDRKMRRLRDGLALSDYVRFSRVLDAVKWDFDKGRGQATPEMVKVLMDLRGMIDDSHVQDPLA
jgi:hypothetical protein